MKKFIIWLCCLYTGVAVANTDPEIIMYEADGEVYYVTGEILEQLKSGADDACLESVIQEDDEGKKSKITKFYELLLSQCRQKIAATSGELKQSESWSDVALAYGANLISRLTKRGLNPLTIENEYKGCVLTLEKMNAALQASASDVQGSYHYTMNADIDACINAIEILPDDNVCPLNPTVKNENIIANIKNINFNYRNKTVVFSEWPNIKSGQVLVFNGTVMVACDNGVPVHVVKPVFSGYSECRDAKYRAYPNVGATPDGIYLIKHDQLEEPEDQESWGGYRIPLVPAQQTQVYGRTNMYLHGTSDATKRRSGGCVSLGIAIDEFIESDWFQNKVQDLLLIVHTN